MMKTTLLPKPRSENPKRRNVTFVLIFFAFSCLLLKRNLRNPGAFFEESYVGITNDIDATPAMHTHFVFMWDMHMDNLGLFRLLQQRCGEANEEFQIHECSFEKVELSESSDLFKKTLPNVTPETLKTKNGGVPKPVKYIVFWGVHGGKPEKPELKYKVTSVFDRPFKVGDTLYSLPTSDQHFESIDNGTPYPRGKCFVVTKAGSDQQSTSIEMKAKEDDKVYEVDIKQYRNLAHVTEDFKYCNTRSSRRRRLPYESDDPVVDVLVYEGLEPIPGQMGDANTYSEFFSWTKKWYADTKALGPTLVVTNACHSGNLRNAAEYKSDPFPLISGARLGEFTFKISERLGNLQGERLPQSSHEKSFELQVYSPRTIKIDGESVEIQATEHKDYLMDITLDMVTNRYSIDSQFAVDKNLRLWDEENKKKKTFEKFILPAISDMVSGNAVKRLDVWSEVPMAEDYESKLVSWRLDSPVPLKFTDWSLEPKWFVYGAHIKTNSETFNFKNLPREIDFNDDGIKFFNIQDKPSVEALIADSLGNTRHSWDAEVLEYKPGEGRIVIGMDKIMSIVKVHESCEELCDGKCGPRFGRTICGIRTMDNEGSCTCYDGSKVKSSTSVSLKSLNKLSQYFDTRGISFNFIWPISKLQNTNLNYS